MDDKTRETLEKIAELSRGWTDRRAMAIYQLAREALGEILSEAMIWDEAIEHGYWAMRHIYKRDFETIWREVITWAQARHAEPEIYEYLKGKPQMDREALVAKIVERLPKLPEIAYEFRCYDKIRTVAELMEWMVKPGVYVVVSYERVALQVPSFQGGVHTALVSLTAWLAAQRRGIVVRDEAETHYIKWVAKFTKIEP